MEFSLFTIATAALQVWISNLWTSQGSGGQQGAASARSNSAAPLFHTLARFLNFELQFPIYKMGIKNLVNYYKD